MIIVHCLCIYLSLLLLLQEEFSSPSAVAAAFTGGSMGTIVDSGTTDCYLPSALGAAFGAAFKARTGVAYRPGAGLPLSQAQLDALPDIVFSLERAGGGSIAVRMPWYNYVAQEDDGKYEFLLFFQERGGAILGANFMDG
jgi:hypothetical protein